MGAAGVDVSGNLTAAAGNIAINGTGGITGTGAISTTGWLTTSSSGGTTLSGANTVGSFNATNTTSGGVSLINTAATLSVGSFTQSANGGMSITNTGNVNLLGNATSNTSLLVKATGDITIGPGAVLYTLAPGAMNVVLNSDSDAVGGGAIVMNAGSSINSNGGNITLGGGVGVISAGAGFAQGYNAPGLYNGVTVNGNLTAGGGNIVVNGITDAVTDGLILPVGVGIAGNVSTTGAGTITLTGHSMNVGPTSNVMVGVSVGYWGVGTVTSAGGNILIDGTTANGINGVGALVGWASTVQSTGAGNVTINGTSGINAAAPSWNWGLKVDTGSQVLSNSGILTLNGNNTATSGPAGQVYGVHILGGGAADTKVASTSGAINITGRANTVSGTGVAIDQPLVANIIGNNTSGDITLTADTLNLAGALIRGTGVLAVKPFTPGTSIGIAGGAGTLALTAANFATNFVPGFLGGIMVGDFFSGAITVGGATSVNDDLILMSGGAKSLKAAFQSVIVGTGV